MTFGKIGVGCKMLSCPCFCITAEEPDVEVRMLFYGSRTEYSPVVNLEASANGVHWDAFVSDSSPVRTIKLALKGSRAYFRAGPGGNSYINRVEADGAGASGCRFHITGGVVSLSGNIMSLLDPELRMVNLRTGGVFSSLFFDSSVVDASELILPATTLSYYCYNRMFQDCPLRSAPALPATNLETNCYASMFYGCTQLTSAPALPATKLAPSCYESMFRGCTQLTSAPALPATNLETYCYANMFRGCTQLTSAPALLAPRLISRCYASMFRACTSLASVEASFSAWEEEGYAIDATQQWLLDTKSYGERVFRCPTALGTNGTIERGASRVPEGWTVVNTDA